MKFVYEYRTSDNIKHEGVISSCSRDAAYAELRSHGIRPSRLVDAPGVLNKLFGRGKRWIAILFLAIVSAGIAVVAVRQTRKLEKVVAVIEETENMFEGMSRRQLIGDSGIIEKQIREGWVDVFEHEGERFLAGFAVPGVPVSVRSTSEDEILAALNRKQSISQDDGIEVRQIKAMVEGMKQELREFLSDGGSVMAYGRRLTLRQEEEIGYYNRAKSEIDQLRKAKIPSNELLSIWEDRNNRLRKMGIKLVPMPE